MTGPIVPARLTEGYVDPLDYAPPLPWFRFYITLRRASYDSGTQRSLHGLTDAELAWVGRTITAELIRRQDKGIRLW